MKKSILILLICLLAVPCFGQWKTFVYFDNDTVWVNGWGYPIRMEGAVTFKDTAKIPVLMVDDVYENTTDNGIDFRDDVVFHENVTMTSEVDEYLIITSDGDTIRLSAGTELYMLQAEVGNTLVWGIDSTGIGYFKEKVGIGWTSPDAALHILDADGPQFIITDTQGADSLTVEVDGDGDVTLVSTGLDFLFTGDVEPSSGATYDVGATGADVDSLFVDDVDVDVNVAIGGKLGVGGAVGDSTVKITGGAEITQGLNVTLNIENDGLSGFGGAVGDSTVKITGGLEVTQGMDLDLNLNVDGTSVFNDDVEIIKAAANTILTLSTYHDTEATTPLLTLRKADNTEASPALVDSAAILGTINFDGYDGSGWHTGAAIKSRVDDPASDGTDMPAELTFWTTPDASATIAQRMVITNEGSVGIGTATPIRLLTLTKTDAVADGLGVARTSVIRLNNPDFSVGSTTGIQFGSNAGAPDNQVFGMIGTVLTNATSNWGGALVFGTKVNQGATDLTEYMRLAMGGNVGIGTTAPGTTLEIADNTGNAAHPILTMLNTNSTATGETGQTVDVIFEVLGTVDSGTNYTNEEAGKLSVYKIGDYWTAGGQADNDAGLKLYTVTDGAYVLNSTFSDNDLTVVDVLSAGSLGLTGDITITKDDPAIYYDPSTASESEWWTGVNHDAGGDDNDNFEIRQSATPGTNVEFYVQPDGDGFITGDFTITGDDLFMNTNTTGYILRADNTNYNPVKFDDSGDLAGFLDDETGSTYVVFSNAPTFTGTVIMSNNLNPDASQGADIGASGTEFNLVYADSIHANWFGGSDFELGESGSDITIDADSLKGSPVAALGVTTITGNIGATTYGSNASVSDAELLVVGALTASASEINTPLDGALVTLTEFQELETIETTTISANQWAALGGIAETLASAELDILDGVTGVTAAELSYSGDVTGLIQAQIDLKAPLASPTFTGAFTTPGIDDNADAIAITIDVTTEEVNFSGLIDGNGAIGGTNNTLADSLEITGNVSATTYGSDGSVLDAELLTIDDGATTEILVGGGAGSAPAWTTATGSGAPARAGSPTFTTQITTPIITNTTTITMDATGDSAAAYVEVIDDQNNGYLNLGRTNATAGIGSRLSIVDSGNDNAPGFLSLYEDDGNGTFLWVSTASVLRGLNSTPADDDAGGYAIMNMSDGTIGATGQAGTFSTLNAAGAFTSLGIDDNADANALTISSGEIVTFTQAPVFASYTRHHDIQVGGATVGATAPTATTVGTARGLGFNADAEVVHFAVEVPTEWNGSSNMTINVHWYPADGDAVANGETVKWDITYRSIDEGEAIDNGNTVIATATLTGGASETDKEYYITPITIVYTGGDQPLAAGDILVVQFDRDTGVDTYSGLGIVMRWDLTYTATALATH